MDSPTPRLQPPQYIPPPHLANVSFITPEQLTYLFQDFHASLDRIAVAPDFVFDRLVANLSTAVTAFIEQDRNNIAGEYEFYGDSRNDYVEVKIAELNSKVAELEMRSQQQERDIDCLNRENSLLLSAKNYLEGELAKQESRGSGFQPRDYAEEKIDITRSLDDQPKTEIANPQPIASADLEGDNTLSATREPHAENEESPQIRLETSEIQLDLDEKSCDLQKLRTKITSLESFISSLKADLVEMAVTISVVEIERDEKSSALGLMEKDNAALQSSISALKVELEDLRSAGSSGRAHTGQLEEYATPLTSYKRGVLA